MSTGILLATPQSNLWPAVWKLLRLRVTILISNFKRGKTRQKVGTILLALFLLLLGAGSFVLSWFLLRVFRSPTLVEWIDVGQVIPAIPTMILTFAFILTLLTNFGVLLQGLYLSKDMNFLISAPLPMRAVFLAKLIEAILPNFGLFCLAALPVMFGLGASSHFNFLYYIFVLLLLALLAMAGSGIASILVMAVVRVVPAKRVAEVLGFLGALISILLGQSGNIFRAANIEGEQMATALTTFAKLNSAWSPFAWAGKGLLDIGSGLWASGVPLIGLSLALSGGIFFLTLRLAEKLYYSGWASMQGSVQKKRVVVARKDLSIQRPGLSRIFPPQFRAIFLKDYLLLRRDLRNMSQLITPLIIGVVMMLSTLRMGNEEEVSTLAELPFSNLGLYANIALSIFVSWMLLFSLATTAFSREGKNYWLIQAAPVRSRPLILSKFFIAYLPAFLMGSLFIVLANLMRPTGWNTLPYSLFIMACCLAGITGILLSAGIAGARMDWENPRQSSLRGYTGCLVFIFSAIYFFIVQGAFFAPTILWEVISGQTALIADIIGLLLGMILSAAGAIIPLILVHKRLSSIGQTQ